MLGSTANVLLPCVGSEATSAANAIQPVLPRSPTLDMMGAGCAKSEMTSSAATLKPPHDRFCGVGSGSGGVTPVPPAPLPPVPCTAPDPPLPPPGGVLGSTPIWPHCAAAAACGRQLPLHSTCP